MEDLCRTTFPQEISTFTFYLNQEFRTLFQESFKVESFLCCLWNIWKINFRSIYMHLVSPECIGSLHWECYQHNQ